jgi:hypothetical protein
VGNAPRNAPQICSLKKIGVSSGSKKRNCLIVGYVGYDPIALYMTFGKAFQIAVKFVFTASFGQRFVPNKKYHDIKDFVQILMAFLHQFEVFFELVSEGKIKHGLYI